MDAFSKGQRSAIMRRVRSKDTTPELQVRSLLHRIGYRFRLHRSDLAGCPDIVLPMYRTVIFVNGCFWHRHIACPRATTPASRLHYWLPKFERTVRRDRRNQRSLEKAGWNVMVVWECELKRMGCLAKRLDNALKKRLPQSASPIGTTLRAAEEPAPYVARRRS